MPDTTDASPVEAAAPGDAPAVSIVVPIYDEAGNIEPLHAAICAAVGHLDFEVLYVNDGSKDGSAAELDAIPGLRSSTLCATTARLRRSPQASATPAGR
jgi:dolichol-phosphate mannosyltransferase